MLVLSKPLTLFVVFGLQRSGKTSVASIVRDCCPAVLLGSDLVRRKVLFRREEPRFTKMEMATNYDWIFFKAKKVLSQGFNVVIDATFADEEQRKKMINFVQRFRTEKEKTSRLIFKPIYVECPDELVPVRFKKDKASSIDYSTAGMEARESYRKKFGTIDWDYTIISNEINCKDYKGFLKQQLVEKGIL